MSSSRRLPWRCSKLGAVGISLAIGVAGVGGCDDQNGDGAGSEADAAASGSVPSIAEPAESLPVMTTPVEDTTGLVRYTDREVDLNALQVPETGRDSVSKAVKIADARRAGPASIAAKASVIDRAAETGGHMLPIRGGRNGWVCVPDDPVTPVDDPVCLSGVAQRWASGWYKGLDSFPHDGLGVAYKLRGGATASKTDPYLIRPLDGDSWIIEPPHVILIFQDTTGLGALPDDPSEGGPWVSWRGTPYQSVKVPLAP